VIKLVCQLADDFIALQTRIDEHEEIPAARCRHHPDAGVLPAISAATFLDINRPIEQVERCQQIAECRRFLDRVGQHFTNPDVVETHTREIRKGRSRI